MAARMPCDSKEYNEQRQNMERILNWGRSMNLLNNEAETGRFKPKPPAQPSNTQSLPERTRPLGQSFNSEQQSNITNVTNDAVNNVPNATHSLHEADQQTSDWMLKMAATQIQNQPKLNALAAPLQWDQKCKTEIKIAHVQPKKIGKSLLKINTSEAKLRDCRDEQIKFFLDLGTTKYACSPEFSELFKKLSSELALLSAYHDATLNRVDNRSLSGIDMMQDMQAQLMLQLNCFIKDKKKFESKFNKYQKKSMQMPKMGGGWFNQRNQMSFNMGMQMNGQRGYQQQNMLRPSRSTQKLPGDANMQAKKAKESLLQLSKLFERYWFENHTIIRNSIRQYFRSYIEYHAKSLQIYTKCYDLVESIDPKQTSSKFISSLGMQQMVETLESKIKLLDQAQQQIFSQVVQPPPVNFSSPQQQGPNPSQNFSLPNGQFQQPQINQYQSIPQPNFQQYAYGNNFPRF